MLSYASIKRRTNQSSVKKEDIKKFKEHIEPLELTKVEEEDKENKPPIIANNSTGVAKASELSIPAPKKNNPFVATICPIRAAQAIANRNNQNSDEVLKKVNDYFDKIINKKEPQVYRISALTMQGLWAEETYYQLLLFKYQERYKINEDGKGFVATHNNKNKTVKVAFPNLNKYYSYTESRVPSAYGSMGYDIQIYKVYNNAYCKINYLEVKSTLAKSTSTSMITFSGPENQFMLDKKRKETTFQSIPVVKQTYYFVRFFSTGRADVSYARFKKEDIETPVSTKYKM